MARRLGAGDRRGATALGIDGVWLALGIGVALMVVGLAASSWIVDAMGASPGVRPYALDYLRISLLGAPFMLIGFAGAGYLRGVQDTRSTLYVAVGGSLVNLVLEVLFVYGFDWGIQGSAVGTVIAQAATMPKKCERRTSFRRCNSSWSALAVRRGSWRLCVRT